MKFELILRKLQVKNIKQIKKIKLIIKFGDMLQFQSSEQIPINNIYPFLQKNTLQFYAEGVDYLSIELMSNNKLIAHKTLFLRDALKHQKIHLNQPENDHHSYKLYYDLKIQETQEQQAHHSPKLQHKKSIRDQPEKIKTQQGKLQIIKMGVLMLDPVIKLNNRMKTVLSWQDPIKTLIFGCLLTFMIIYPRITIGLFGMVIIFGRHYIINKAADYELKKDISKRLIVPQQNVVFLQNNMEEYCNVYQQMNKFLRSDDKSDIITVINIICKLGAIVFILSIFFSLQILLISGLWIGLIMLSPKRKQIISTAKPKIIQANKYLDQFIKKIGGFQVVFNFLQEHNSDLVQILKQFYIYQHQRWWVGRQWVPSHWSNQDRQLHLLARKQPPKGWKWIQDWQIQYSQDTDYEGYEYSHDLLKQYNSSKSLKTLRRRKWTRKCMKKVSIIKDKEN